MSARSIILGAVATLLAGLAGTAEAQVWQPFGPVDYRHDFAPFQTFDIKNMSGAPDPQEGFFFTFEKLSWATSGEHTTLGNPDVVDFYPDVLRGVDPPQVFNGITETAPEATFGWGERYEFGYIVDHHGWTASVLDYDVSDYETYGFYDRVFDHPENDAVFVNELNPGSGQVIILFDANPNALLGFLFGDPDGDGVYDFPVDLNFDVDLDLDDLISYLPYFDRVDVSNHIEMDGIELMKTYRFKQTSRGSVVEFSYGARYLRLHDNFRVDAWGGPLNQAQIPEGAAPEILVSDDRSFWDTTIDNHIVGPQVALKWSKRQGRFTYTAGGRFTFGYNVQDHDQVGQMGTQLHLGFGDDTIVETTPPVIPDFNVHRFAPGPYLLGNQAFRHGKQEQDFSPLVEFRTEVGYNLTQDFALKLGFNATFIDNVRRAAPSVRYVLPTMGFRDVGTQEILAAGVNLGVEFNR